MSGTRNNNSYHNGQYPFESMSPEEKKMRIDQLWAKARRYNNKLRL